MFSKVDLFCNVIDNYGDVGFVLRLARALGAHWCQSDIRIYINDFVTLASFLETCNPESSVHQEKGLTFVHFDAISEQYLDHSGTAPLVVEIFGCEIPHLYMERATHSNTLIINLEYLTAESWSTEYHKVQSLLGYPTVKKHFFMPGFSDDTGGLVLNTHLGRIIDRIHAHRRYFLSLLSGVSVNDFDSAVVGSVFSYVRDLRPLIRSLRTIGEKVILLVGGEKSQLSMRHALGLCDEKGVGRYSDGTITTVFLPFLSQESFDLMLYCTDFNIVRGEDSLARAVLAAKPFLWQAYIQDNRYQLVKVRALLDQMRHYFDDEGIFKKYSESMMEFNDVDKEGVEQGSKDCYTTFLSHRREIEHASQNMSYFITRHCNLVRNFTDFASKTFNEYFPGQVRA